MSGGGRDHLESNAFQTGHWEEYLKLDIQQRVLSQIYDCLTTVLYTRN